MRSILLSLIFLIPLQFPLAWELPRCEDTLQKSDVCIIHVEDLHPTQFAVGMRLVKKKAKKLQEMQKDERHDYLEENPAPVIIGPKGIFYPIDHHHLARAVLESGHAKMVARIKENWRMKALSTFWKEMENSNYLHLYDEQGRGPLSPVQLPTRIAQLKDDPYRSLAAIVRDKGCFRKTKTPFAEFKWANFFRARITLGSSKTDFKKAVREALPLCHAPEAKGLPGYSLCPSFTQNP